MALDPNIALQVRAPQFEDPLSSYGRMLAAEAAQQGNSLRAMQTKQIEQNLADEEASRNALRAFYGSDRGDNALRALAQASPGAYAAEVKRQQAERKDRADVADKEAETNNRRIKALQEKTDVYRSALEYVDSPQAAARWLESQYNDPILGEHMRRVRPFEEAVQTIPQTPAEFQRWRQQASLGLKNFLDYQRQRDNDLIVRDAQGNPSTNMPLVAAKSAIAAAGAPPQVPITVQTTSGGMGVIPTRIAPGATSVQVIPVVEPGQAGAAPGTPGQRAQPAASRAAPTEGQANAALYSTRMEEAHQVLGDLQNQYNPVAVNALNSTVPGLSMVVNPNVSPQTQQVAQAQRNFINAALRRESGATIQPHEFANANQQYFPQFGDSPEVIEQKAKNRQTAIEGIRNAAGPFAPQRQGSAPPRPGSAPPRAASPGVPSSNDPLGILGK